MGLFSRNGDSAAVPPVSMVASAAQIQIEGIGIGWKNYKFGDQSWQAELWRLYDIVGEFRMLADWVGSACSRVRIYVAEVDDRGNIIGEVTDDDDISALGDSILGGPAAKSEALRSLGINLTVAGESYIIGRSIKDKENDEWLVVSASELRRYGGGAVYDANGDKIVLKQGSDILIRVWTPHPRRMWWANSPAKAALPVLVEIERLTKFVFSQLDSRLIGGGVWFIPNNMTFPANPGEPEMSASDTLMSRLVQAGEASARGEGTAARVLPIVAEVPLDTLQHIREPIRFESVLSEQAMKLRDEALRRLALAMDSPPEVLFGTGDANHWSGVLISAESIKSHIEPIMIRICDGLNKSYLKSALEILKKDPKRYSLWFDTAPLVARPMRLQDTLNLYGQQIVNRKAVLRAGDYLDEDEITEEEQNQRFLRDVILRDPNLLQSPAIRQAAGLGDSVLPPEEIAPTPPPPPPVPERSIQQVEIGATPRNSQVPGALAASASEGLDIRVLVGISEGIARRALELAGGRLMDSKHRSMFTGPRHTFHTQYTGEISPDRVGRLMAGAWEHVPAMAQIAEVDPVQLASVLSRYCTELLVNKKPHDPAQLVELLQRYMWIGNG